MNGNTEPGAIPESAASASVAVAPNAESARAEGDPARAERVDGAERGEREGRGRGRGRDRDRPRGDRPAADPMTAPQGLGEGALADAAASEIAAPMSASLLSVDDDLVAVPEPAPAAAAFVPAPAASVAEPVRAEAARVAPVAPAEFELPVDSLAAIAESAGLQWVNSDAEKIRAVQAALDNEPAPVRVPRERKPVDRADQGPLVLVETRKDLSQYKLPFETAAQGNTARD
ncbi:MAG: hypothetical protein ABIO45_19215 [Burkholderiaceae bacterium]